MENLETLEKFYQRHPVPNQKVFAENNTGQGHFNVFLRKPCIGKIPFSRRDFYKVTLIIGEGKMIYADKEVIIKQPALVFSSPAVPSACEFGPGPQAGGFCLFTQDFFESHEHKNALHDFPMFKVGGTHIVFLNETQLQFISATIEKMIEEMNSDYVNKYDLLRNYLRIIMHEALKIAPVFSSVEKTGSASTRITTLFLELLERQFPIDSPDQGLKLKTANDYAQSLAMHTNHLNRAVKEVTGKTTTQHIADRVLKEAHALLKHSDWNISQIANGLGFEEPAYFANFFKKYNGSSPANYRVSNIDYSKK